MQPCLFSVSYAGFWGQARLDLPAFLAKAAQLGYPAVMLAGKRPHLSPLDYDVRGPDSRGPLAPRAEARQDDLVRLQSLLHQHGLNCPIIGGYTDLSPAAAAEVPHLEIQIAYVESMARIAQALGAKFVRVFTAYETPGHSPQSIWTGVVRALQEMCDRAADFGVIIAVENHPD